MKRAAPSLTIIVPAHNEGAALEMHLAELMRAFDGFTAFAPIDYVVIDDGSTDETYDSALRIARRRDDVLLVRHETNRGLGAALRTGVAHATGDYVLTVDSDLSYSTNALKRLLYAALDQDVDVVMASAYMKGGTVRGVPWMRAFLSREANRFLSLATGGSYATITCMVRVYRRTFLERLPFTADGMDVNAQLTFQALRANGKIVEVPAALEWPLLRRRNAGRASLSGIVRLTWRTMKCGLAYRPALVLGIPGLVSGLLPAVVAAMFVVHLSPRAIAIGTIVTLIVQYGSLAILGGQAFAFARRRYVARRVASPDPQRARCS